jgi:RNA polymerase sigma-70 factor (ECF subfamily)
MSSASLEGLFDRYRRHGDLAALGEVFDRVAPDLLRLACHLVRGHDAAEDVLQATFVAAIEGASRFDSTHALRPWLTGILARQASTWRRRESRTIDETRLDAPNSRTPLDAAAAKELSVHLDSALARLGEPYRTCLELYLRRGSSPARIARELGLAPGTVRMRIHRGLERLRSLLPAGVAAGLAWSWLAPRGLAAVRTAVLTEAGSWAPVAAGTSTAAATGGTAGTGAAAAGSSIGTNVIIAGSLLMSKTAPAVIALGLLGLLTALWMTRDTVTSLPDVAVRSIAAASSSDATGAPISGPRPHSSVLNEDPQASQLAADGPTRRSIVTPPHPTQPRVVLRGVIEGPGPGEMSDATVTYSPRKAGESDMSLRAALTFQTSPLQQRNLVLHDLATRSLDMWESRLDSSETPEKEAREGAQPGPDGRFELICEAPESNEAFARGFDLRASHPLFFDAVVEVVPGAEELRALALGRDVVLEARIRLVPAAVLRGRAVSRSTTDVDAAGELQGDRLELDEGGTISLVSSASPGTLLVAMRVSHRFMLRDLGPSMQAGLFDFDHGQPGIQPVATTNLDGEGRFEIKVPEGGCYALAVVRDGQRPATQLVELIVRQVVELEPIELNPGASITGFAPALDQDAAAACTARASLLADGDCVHSEWAGGLSWVAGRFEWAARERELGPDGSFRLDGLAQANYMVELLGQVDLDVRRLPGLPIEEPIPCAAPARDLVLGGRVAFIDLVLTHDGVPLDELADAGGPEPEDVLRERPGLTLEFEVVDTAYQVSVGEHASFSMLTEADVEARLSLFDDEGSLQEFTLRTAPSGRRQRVEVSLDRPLDPH